jgi:hypothetical protein
VQTIERRDDAVVNNLSLLQSELGNRAQDWASSADVATRELAKQLKGALDASEELD